MSSRPLRIALIDDRLQQRAKLSHCINSDHIYVAPYECLSECLEYSDFHDYVLIQYSNFQRSIVGDLRRNGCHSPVVAYDDSPDVNSVVSAMRCGADYFIDIHDVSSITDKIITMSRELNVEENYDRNVPHYSSSEYGSLSDRERSILNLVSEGHTSKEIGRILDISPRTVDAHRANIMKKTKSPRMANAVRKSALHTFTTTKYPDEQMQ